jgi:leucyl-tRNA synthetase
MQEALQAIVLMLSPIVPHISHELWQCLGGANAGAVVEQPWPKYDESALVRSSIEMMIQVNGKLRGKIEVPVNADKAAIEKMALENSNIIAFIEGKELKKIIVVPGRLINLVVA